MGSTHFGKLRETLNSLLCTRPRSGVFALNQPKHYLSFAVNSNRHSNNFFIFFRGNSFDIEVHNSSIM